MFFFSVGRFVFLAIGSIQVLDGLFFLRLNLSKCWTVCFSCDWFCPSVGQFVFLAIGSVQGLGNRFFVKDLISRLRILKNRDNSFWLIEIGLIFVGVFFDYQKVP